MTRYKEYFQKMLRENKDVFDSFTRLHFEYSIDQNGLQKKFNEEGEKVLEVIRDYENRLCANTERGMYNKYSTGLAEKFQTIVKSHFPLIDHVGLIPQQPLPTQTKNEASFSLKKIKLS
jgi:sugar-specific transcriptional regulator TrmB